MYNIEYFLVFQVIIVIINTFARYYYLNDCIDNAFKHDNKDIIREGIYGCLNFYYTKN